MNDKRRVYGFIHGICTTSTIFVIVPAILGAVATMERSKVLNHYPIEEVEVAHTKEKEDIYEVTAKSGTNEEAGTIEVITIDGEEIRLPYSDYVERIGANTKQISTEIYRLEITSKESYPGDFMANRRMHIVRFSALGESDFTEEEISSYKERAKEILTKEKYASFGDTLIGEPLDYNERLDGKWRVVPW